MKVLRHNTLDVAAEAAAEEIATFAERCVARTGWFVMALSGGRTPSVLFRLLAKPPYADRIVWDRCDVFWSDERCVPPRDPESNYRMAHDLLLDRVPVPPRNVHRIKGELPPSEAADRYEETLRRVLGARDAGEAPAELFDLVLLGMGVDGHTASLFPGNDALGEKTRWVVDVTAPPGIAPAARVTMTLPVLNAAERVLFLTAGEDKAVLLDRIRNDPEAARSIPAAMVRGVRETVWHMAETG